MSSSRGPVGIRDEVKREKGHKVMGMGEPEVKETRGSVKAGEVM